MRIKKVRLSGFDKLYEGYYTSFKENRAGFQSGLFDFMNHCMIGIELTEITTIELFYLKKFCSSLKIISKEYGNFVNEKEIDIHQKIEGVVKLHDEMLNDEDINKNKNYIDNILPIGCEMYHVIAIFKGSSIASITGGIVENIFKDEGKFFESYPPDIIMENKIAEKFYNSFYTYMSTLVTSIDITTEFMNNKKFYQYADSNCNLSNVNTPFGEIVFFNNNENILNKQVQNIIESMQTSPFVFKDQIYFTFVLKTSFSVFMDIYLNSNFVIDHENLKLVFLKENINLDNDILNKYNARLTNSIAYLISHKKELNNAEGIDLNKFNFIFNGNEIIYSIQVPLDKMNHFNLVNLDNSEEVNSLFIDIQNISNVVANLIGVN